MWYDTITLFILGMCTGSVITYLALSKYLRAHIEAPTFDEHVQGIERFFEQDFNWDPDWCHACANEDALERGVPTGNGYTESPQHPSH